MTDPSPTTWSERWRRRVVEPVRAQLRQGLTPERAALTVGLGAAIAVFPILGSTTLLCLVAGVCLRLNQPILQGVNWLLSGAQLLLIPFFVRTGEWLTQAAPVPFAVGELVQRFQSSPTQFLADFGITGLRAILAWGVLAPLVAAGLYYSLLPGLRRWAAARTGGGP